MTDIEFKTATLSKKTIAGTLKKILVQIEEAIESGASYDDIVKALADQEILKISVGTFRQTLHRLRQKKVSSNETIRKPNQAILSNDLKPIGTSVEAKMETEVLSKSELRIRKANHYMDQVDNPLLKQIMEKHRG